MPEPRTFNIVMNACNAAGQYGDCISVHERMLNQNVSPTVGTCNAVLLAYCKYVSRNQHFRSALVCSRLLSWCACLGMAHS